MDGRIYINESNEKYKYFIGYRLWNKKVSEKHPELLNKELQERWNPWKTYITIGLWNYLEKWSNEMQMKYIKKG